MNKELLLDGAIESGFEDLKGITAGSKEYNLAVESIAKLIDKSNDIEKFYFESGEKVDGREFDESFKKAQAEKEDRDRKIRNGIAIAGIAVPSIITIWGTLKSFKFEQTGTITTIMGRGFVNKLLPKK